MKLNILSDLHLSRGELPLPANDADVVILAGDIARPAEAVAWASRLDKPVLYVPGNHEYYGGEYHAVHTALRAAAGAIDGVHLMDCDAWHYRGMRFLGCTLWSDYSLVAEPERAAAMNALRRFPDYRAIGMGGRKFRPEDSVALCARQRAWLAARLDEPFAGTTVVITHFVPHRGSIAPRFADDIANPAFIVPLDELMGRAALWIHGHTHSHFDYAVNGTRIIANPRGYPGEITGFQPALTVDIPEPV